MKLDDEFVENEKVGSISDRAFRVHIAGLCYCGRLLTDGFLDMRAQRVVLATADGQEEHKRELVAAKLWVDRGDGRLEIKDYLEYNPSRAKVLAERAKVADRVRRNRERNADRNGVSNGVSNTPPVPVPLPQDKEPIETPNGVLSTKSSTTDIQEVYDCWRAERGKTNGRYNTMSPARRQKIKTRLKEFSPDELKQAIKAVALDPWHERDQHDDLTVIFRSQEQVDRFLAFQKTAPTEDDVEARIRRRFEEKGLA